MASNGAQASDSAVKPVALVTGASRGIGAAIAAALARAGYHLVLVARTEAGLIQTEDRIHDAGGTATIVPLDLARGSDIDKLGHAIAQRFGRLDLLVLNAAILGTLTPVGHQEPDEFEAVMAVNLVSQHRLLRAFDPALRQTRGMVVAVTSSVGQQPRAYWGAYAASKAALENLVATYALETRAMGVRAILLDPGATRTAMRAAAYPGEDPADRKSPETVADALVTALPDARAAAGIYRLRVPS